MKVFEKRRVFEMVSTLAVIGSLSIMTCQVYSSRNRTETGNRIEIKDTDSDTPVYPQVVFHEVDPVSVDKFKEQNQIIEDLSRQISLLKEKIDSLPNPYKKNVYENTGDKDADKNDDFYENQTALLEDTVESEQIDGEWAGLAEREIKDRVYAVKDSNVSISDLDCRSTLCRVGISFDPSDQEETFNRIHDYLPWESEIFFKIKDVTPGEAVVYVARKDYDLPRFTY